MSGLDTLLLDQTTWDLVVDSDGNIAIASPPYSQAQDAASAIRTFLGEVYYDTTLGVDYSRILYQFPSISQMKQAFVEAAETVPGVVSAIVFITTFNVNTREITGQVQITNTAGQTSAVAF